MKAQWKKRLFFYVLSLVLGMTCVIQAAMPAPDGNSRLSITYEKNIELLGLLANLDEDEESLHPLAREMRQYFLAFKDHDAVKMTRKLLRRASREFISRLALHLTDFPEAQLLYPSVTSYKRRLLKTYVSAVRKFYEVSRFETIWENIRPKYEILKCIISDKLIEEDLVKTMEDFYGIHKDDYTLVFTPQFSQLRLNCEMEQRGQSHAYVIHGPWKNGLFNQDFISTEDLILTVAVHEFGHILVEPILKNNEKLLKKYSRIHAKVPKIMKKFGYNSWYSVFLENLLRAIEAKIACKIFDETNSQRWLEKYAGEGFRLTGIMFELLHIYEKSRDSYPSFDRFLPFLLENLDEKIENI
jgi:hypothetical protein